MRLRAVALLCNPKRALVGALDQRTRRARYRGMIHKVCEAARVSTTMHHSSEGGERDQDSPRYCRTYLITLWTGWIARSLTAIFESWSELFFEGVPRP